MSTLIFVYGSLMKNHHNHSFVKNSEFIGKYVTKDRYNMVSFGAFPAVFEHDKKYHIAGELYSIDDTTLRMVDGLEGNGYLYKRKQIKLEKFDEQVWIYFFMDENEIDYDFSNITVRGNIVSWD